MQDVRRREPLKSSLHCPLHRFSPVAIGSFLQDDEIMASALLGPSLVPYRLGLHRPHRDDEPTRNFYSVEFCAASASALGGWPGLLRQELKFAIFCF